VTGLWGAALLIANAASLSPCAAAAALLVGGDRWRSLLLAYGLMWSGARLSKAGLWSAARRRCRGRALVVAAFMTDMTARIELFSLLACIYTLMTVSEYRRARDRSLIRDGGPSCCCRSMPSRSPVVSWRIRCRYRPRSPGRRRRG
jgi:hypothetical protein